MRTHTPNFVLAGIALAAGFWTSPSGHAGEVQGEVVTFMYNVGIGDADVTLVSTFPARTLGPKRTNAAGHFTFKDVPDGIYNLVVSRIGYQPNPHKRILVKVEKGAVDITPKFDWPVELYPIIAWNKSEKYDKGIGTKICKTAPDGADQKSAYYRNQWAKLGALNFPPSRKVFIASQLAEMDPSAKEAVSDIGKYLESPQANIQTIEQRFRRALTSGVAIPGKEELARMSVPDEVIADVAIFTQAQADPDKQKEFNNKFIDTWGRNSDAVKDFLAKSDEVRPPPTTQAPPER